MGWFALYGHPNGFARVASRFGVPVSDRNQRFHEIAIVPPDQPPMPLPPPPLGDSRWIKLRIVSTIAIAAKT